MAIVDKIFSTGGAIPTSKEIKEKYRDIEREKLLEDKTIEQIIKDSKGHKEKSINVQSLTGISSISGSFDYGPMYMFYDCSYGGIIRLPHENQTYGTCGSHALSKLLEFMEYKQTKQVVKYSSSWIYGNRNMTDHQMSGLAMPQAALKLVNDGCVKISSSLIGSDFDKDHPYNDIEAASYANTSGETWSYTPFARDMVSKNYNSYISSARSNIKPKSFNSLTPTTKNIIDALYNNGPLVVTVDGSYAITAAYKAPPHVIDTSTYGGNAGSHYMLLVGTKGVDIEGNGVYKECFILWNSWGEDTGEYGNIYVPYTTVDANPNLLRECWKFNF